MSNIMLESLYIDNFKSFKDSKFEFGKLNCLIAPNNTGKSNLIEALEFLDNLIYQNPAVAIAKIGYDKLKNHHYEDDKEVYINAKFLVKHKVLVGDELIDYDINLSFIFELDFETKKINIDILATGKAKSILIDIGDIVDGFEVVRVYKGFDKYIYSDDKYLGLLSKKRYGKFVFRYSSSTLRYSLDYANSTTQKIVKKLFALEFSKNNEELVKPIEFRLLFNRNSLFSSHYFQTHEIKKPEIFGTAGLAKSGKNLVEYLESIDKDKLEDISTSLISEVELISSIELNDGLVTKLVFKEEINGKTYDVELQNISDGTIHFIAIMSALVGNQYSIGMMIEEPERHMHMKVLSYILNTMRDSDKQIFFTTHSTEMLSLLELDEIIFMFRDYDGDTKGQRAKDIPNIKKIMKRYKNDLVEMIKCGIVGEYDE